MIYDLTLDDEQQILRFHKSMVDGVQRILDFHKLTADDVKPMQRYVPVRANTIHAACLEFHDEPMMDDVVLLVDDDRIHLLIVRALQYEVQLFK